jgi:hypothetical protein
MIEKAGNLSSRALDAVIASLSALATRLRERTEERPLINMVTFQLGLPREIWRSHGAQR